MRTVHTALRVSVVVVMAAVLGSVVGCGEQDEPATPATGAVREMGERAKSAASEVADKATSAASEVADEAASATESAVDAAKDAAGDAASAAVEKATGLLEQAQAAIKGLNLDKAQELLTSLEGMAGSLPDALKDKISALRGALDKAKAATDATATAEGAADAVKDAV